MSTFDFALVGFIAGLAVAGSVGIYYYRRLRVQLTLLHVVNDLGHSLSVVKKLRAEKMAEAIEENETVLDVSVTTLATFVGGPLRHERNRETLFFIRQVKEYRDKFPHRSKYEGADWQVAQAFNLVT